MELQDGACPFTEDKSHLCREDGVGLAALTHSREMKLYPACERPPGPEDSQQPNNSAGSCHSGPPQIRYPLRPKLPACHQEIENSWCPASV